MYERRPLLTLPSREVRPRREGVQLSAKSLKVVLVLDTPAVAEALQPYATVEKRIPMQIVVEGRNLSAEFAPRAVRKLLATVAEHGAGGVSCLIQGRLLRDNSIGDAGLSAQPKTPRPPPVE